MADSDRQAVRSMFDLIHRVVDSLAPGFQVIVTDHANLDEEWFQQTIVEEWASRNQVCIGRVA